MIQPPVPIANPLKASGGRYMCMGQGMLAAR